MIFRTARLADIKHIQVIRHLVKENRLSNPGLVSDKDVAFYISERGRGWVCEVDNRVVGFSIIDLTGRSVWALFVNPEFAEKGIGKTLHQLMIDWYFEQTRDDLVLGTAAHTRAERFYSLQGWVRAGNYPNGELKFSLSYGAWTHKS